MPQSKTIKEVREEAAKLCPNYTFPGGQISWIKGYLAANFPGLEKEDVLELQKEEEKISCQQT